jgi:hypothetical protein
VLGGGKRREDRGLLAKPSSPSSLRFRTEGRNWGRPAGRLRRLPASRGSTAAGDRGKGRGGRGLSTPVLTLVGDGLRRWLRGKGRPAVEVVGGGTDGGGGGALGHCWRLEDGVGSGEKVVPAFYRRRRTVREVRYFRRGGRRRRRCLGLARIPGRRATGRLGQRRLRSSGGSRWVSSGTQRRGGRPAGPGRRGMAGGDDAVV